MAVSVASILKDEGFVKYFKTYNEGSFKLLLIFLKCKGRVREPAITKIKRTTALGSRAHADSKNAPRVLGNLSV